MGAVFGDEGGRAGGCHGGFEIRVVLSRDSNHMDIRKRLLFAEWPRFHSFEAFTHP